MMFLRIVHLDTLAKGHLAPPEQARTPAIGNPQRSVAMMTANFES
jgi:hypothetical protein